MNRMARAWTGRRVWQGATAAPRRPARPPRMLVVLLDGTLSTLEPGFETNVGLIYKLLAELPARQRPAIFYEPGLQWEEWRRRMDVITGVGINRQIRRAYGFLASRYREGDRICLFGYSRGAFAVRSLAGLIDQVGLLKARYATERHVRDAYRHYQCDVTCREARVFSRRHCLTDVPVELVGVFDTVKALGLAVPVVGRASVARHDFHNHHLGPHIRHGYHALALNETRAAFAPVMWETGGDGWSGHVEQVWFPGTHGDVGGQLSGFLPARALSNVPLGWMLGRAAECGLPLPEGWEARHPGDPDAPSSGTMRGWGKLLWRRRARVVGADPSERLHPTAIGRAAPPAEPELASLAE